MRPSLDLTVVIPAHNEGPNLRILLPRLRTILDGLRLASEIVIVVREVDAQTREAVASDLGTIVQQRDPGYGGALRTGFALARGQYILTMDADLSHPPTFAVDLWNQRHSAEVLIASRYVAGAGARMPFGRALLSRVLNGFFARGLSIPLRDLSSGFRLYQASALDMRRVTARDFDILPEIVVRAYTAGWRVLEVPFRYEPRAHGSSNARVIPFGIAYLRTFHSLWSLRNAVSSADYEDRAADSRIPLQRYWQRQRRRHIAGFLEANHRTLDIGCGSSRILGALLSNSVGVDISVEKLRHARRFGRPLVQASALTLPFGDGVFECVVASQLVESFPRASSLFEEISRVLAPGGRLILGTTDYGRWHWILVGALYTRIVPGARAGRDLGRYKQDELVDQLTGRGYRLMATRSILGAEIILAFEKAGQTICASDMG